MAFIPSAIACIPSPGSHEVRRVEVGNLRGLFVREACASEAADASFVHGDEQLAERFVSACDARRVTAARGVDRESVLHGCRHAADSGERCGAAPYGRFESRIERLV